MIRARTVAVLGAAVICCLSCAGLRGPGPVEGPAAALYRGRFDPGAGEKARKFRLLVFAAEPDRLHGEVLSAVGTTELVLDAGGGSVSLLFVRDRVAYVGDSSESALAALLGVRLTPGTLVSVLRGGTPESSDLQWNIVPGDGGYPRRIDLGDGTRTLALELKRLRPIRADPQQLGTGRPPAGVEQRPLEDLDPVELPGVETEDDA